MPVQYLSTGRSDGDEISSTREGRHVTIEESLLTHPPGGDGLVDKGDAVILGARMVGIALASAINTGTLIAVDTEGIWFKNMVGSDDAGGSAITAGDEIYINTTTCVLSKITNIATQIPFGIAMGTGAGGGATTLVAIKVHHDPSIDNQVAKFHTVPTGQYSYGWSMRATVTGQSEGLSMYLEGHMAGVQVGGVYNHGSWINVDAGATLNGSIVVPYEGGIYTSEAQAAARIVFAGQHMAILNGAPASLHAWRLNATQTVDALIAAANPGSVGWVAGAGVAGAKTGGVPMFDIVGVGIAWVRCYATGL